MSTKPAGFAVETAEEDARLAELCRPGNSIAWGVAALADRATEDNAATVTTKLTGLRTRVAAYGTFRLVDGKLRVRVCVGEPPKKKPKQKNGATAGQQW